VPDMPKAKNKGAYSMRFSPLRSCLRGVALTLRFVRLAMDLSSRCKRIYLSRRRHMSCPGPATVASFNFSPRNSKSQRRPPLLSLPAPPNRTAASDAVLTPSPSATSSTRPAATARSRSASAWATTRSSSRLPALLPSSLPPARPRR
jgi:hypothetical protein